MANTASNKPQLLSIPQIEDIHRNHPPTGKAIQSILDYINGNVTPPQGTKIGTGKNVTPGGNP